MIISEPKNMIYIQSGEQITQIYFLFVQGLLKVYLLLLALYTVLTPVQYSAAIKQKHPITRLLTAALVSEYVAILLTSIHYGLFALNGEGIPAFNTLGDIMEIFAQVKPTSSSSNNTGKLYDIRYFGLNLVSLVIIISLNRQFYVYVYFYSRFSCCYLFYYQWAGPLRDKN